MSHDELPHSCLTYVLEFVPVRERLCTCALVNTAWSAAAAAATHTLCAVVSDSQPCSNIVRWVHSHRRHIRSLTMSTVFSTAPAVDGPVGWSCDLQHLLHPNSLPALQTLHLSSLQLSFSAAHPPNSLGPINTALTRLAIQGCRAVPDLSLLSCLASLQHLQHLQLHVLVPPQQQTAAPGPPWRLPGRSVWSQLTALTHLDLLDQHNVTDDTLQALTCLTHLRELKLLAALLSPAAFLALPHLLRLSALALQLAPHIAFTQDSTPVLLQLQGLRAFKVRLYKEMQPQLLASLTQLQDLCLELWSGQNSLAGVTSTLAALSHLTALTSLALSRVLRPQPTWNLHPAAEELHPSTDVSPSDSAALSSEVLACGAVTASSVLRSLTLRLAVLPAAAWRAIFPEQRRLVALQHLEVDQCSPLLTDADLALLGRCCPRLTSLTLKKLDAGASLGPLTLVTGLSQLYLWHVHGDAGARTLAQLTALRCLYSDDSHLSRDGLLLLTALRQLTHLHVHYSPTRWKMPRNVTLKNSAPLCHASNVPWKLQQLLQAKLDEL